jgi:hypothetical protein
MFLYKLALNPNADQILFIKTSNSNETILKYSEYILNNIYILENLCTNPNKNILNKYIEISINKNITINNLIDNYDKDDVDSYYNDGRFEYNSNLKTRLQNRVFSVLFDGINNINETHVIFFDKYIWNYIAKYPKYTHLIIKYYDKFDKNQKFWNKFAENTDDRAVNLIIKNISDISINNSFLFNLSLNNNENVISLLFEKLVYYDDDIWNNLASNTNIKVINLINENWNKINKTNQFYINLCKNKNALNLIIENIRDLIMTDNILRYLNLLFENIEFLNILQNDFITFYQLFKENNINLLFYLSSSLYNNNNNNNNNIINIIITNFNLIKIEGLDKIKILDNLTSNNNNDIMLLITENLQYIIENHTYLLRFLNNLVDNTNPLALSIVKKLINIIDINTTDGDFIWMRLAQNINAMDIIILNDEIFEIDNDKMNIKYNEYLNIMINI